MKVLLCLHHHFDPDLGAPGATLSLGNALEQAGCQVEYFGFGEAFHDGPSAGVVNMMRFPWKVAAFLARHGKDFDVVDASTGDNWVWARQGRPGAKRHHALLTRSHGLEQMADQRLRQDVRAGHVSLSWKYPLYHGGFRLWEVKQSLRRADRCILLNDMDLDFVRDRLSVPPERLTVLPNGISRKFHTAAPLTPPTDGPLHLAFVGTWIARKGHRIVAEAAAILRDTGVDFRLRLLGTISEAAAVLTDFPERVRDPIQITPRYKNTDLPDLLYGQEVLLFPSQSEGFGLALAEAMACGLAPVSTPVGIAPSVIVSGKNGLLIPIDDSGALAGAVQRLAADPEGLFRMRCLSQKSVAPYQWDKIAARTIQVYEQVLSRNAAVLS